MWNQHYITEDLIVSAWHIVIICWIFSTKASCEVFLTEVLQKLEKYFIKLKKKTRKTFYHISTQSETLVNHFIKSLIASCECQHLHLQGAAGRRARWGAIRCSAGCRSRAFDTGQAEQQPTLRHWELLHSSARPQVGCWCCWRSRQAAAGIACNLCPVRFTTSAREMLPGV